MGSKVWFKGNWCSKPWFFERSMCCSLSSVYIYIYIDQFEYRPITKNALQITKRSNPQFSVLCFVDINVHPFKRCSNGCLKLALRDIGIHHGLGLRIKHGTVFHPFHSETETFFHRFRRTPFFAPRKQSASKTPNIFFQRPAVFVASLKDSWLSRLKCPKDVPDVVVERMVIKVSN